MDQEQNTKSKVNKLYMGIVGAFVISLTSTILLICPASAQNYKTVLDVPEGMTILNISATEREEVEQDLLIANLRYEVKNQDQSVVQDQINKTMAKALKRAKTYSTIKAVTQQYQIYKTSYDPNPHDNIRKKVPTWQGNQGLMLKSKTADDVLKLVGELQTMGLVTNGLSFKVSPELYDKTFDALLEKAITKLQTKAERAGKALGKTKIELIDVNVNGGGRHIQPQYHHRAMMDEGIAMSAGAAPVASAGESNVSLTVSARARLSQ